MAKLIFRHPDDPPKKVMVAKLEKSKNIKETILISLYLIQTALTIVYLIRTL